MMTASVAELSANQRDAVVSRLDDRGVLQGWFENETPAACGKVVLMEVVLCVTVSYRTVEQQF